MAKSRLAIKAVSYPSWPAPAAGSGEEEALAAIARLGADCLRLPLLLPSGAAAEDAAAGRLSQLIKLAHAKRLQVILSLQAAGEPFARQSRGKPQSSQSGENPAGAVDKLLRFGRLAQRGRVEYLALGETSAGQTHAHNEGHWRQLLRSLRAIYGGKIIYCAGPQTLQAVKFWDKADLIGVNALFPLNSAKPRPSPSRLAYYCRRWLDLVERFQRGKGRGVMLSAVGYPTRLGGHRYPLQESGEGSPDAAAQSGPLCAILNAFSGRGWCRGFSVCSWSEREPQPGAVSLSIRNPATLESLREFFHSH